MVQVGAQPRRITAEALEIVTRLERWNYVQVFPGLGFCVKFALIDPN